ncbi:RlpA-like double-psi beta-barrel-protein domain-containing protein-containing protein [Lactarius sanguifluus]|nr:RlpA-like double-psi beta-barrel-protein domain-containing protein-containing protein [Lactarius sanguifluus]
MPPWRVPWSKPPLACGKTASGYTAAMNQLAFGAPSGLGPGDACGRCFKVTGCADPYSPGKEGPFKSIIVKVTDLCPVEGNEQWCGQTAYNTTNSFGQSAHFDLCQESGAPAAFFPSGSGALTGTYEEVPCTSWSGTEGSNLWDGACLADESTGSWPSAGCGNKGANFIPCPCRKTFWFM